MRKHLGRILDNLFAVLAGFALLSGGLLYSIIVFYSDVSILFKALIVSATLMLIIFGRLPEKKGADDTDEN